MFGVDDAALALIAAGLISSAGSLYVNHQNLKNQNHVNDVNWQIAAQNNATQIEMANTAHQREVADLRAAGLNPILSAGGNGSSTPSLTSMRGDSAQIENPVNGIANSARSLGRYLSEEYKTQVGQQKADLAATELNNKMLQREEVADRARARLDAEKAHEDKIAWQRVHGMRSFIDKHGQEITYIANQDKYDNALKLHEQAMESYIKDASNLNWRNNLGALSGAINGTINSAASAARAFSGGKGRRR